MKPLKVEFQAFGPYKTKETIDFEKLSSKGLFLITGDTGSGKTTILDAITFALYGKSSGGGRDDFEDMRCKYADDSVPTYVSFEFENNGQIYIFERRIEKKRINYHKTYCVKQKTTDGKFETLFENTKESDITKKAVEIIGLEYAQFVQVIILPQGKFEKFLVSSSDDKARILTSIFGEDKWQTIAAKIYEKAQKRVNELKDTKTKINSMLAAIGVESIDELRELIDRKVDEEKALRTEFTKADFDKTIKENQNLLVLTKSFENLDIEKMRKEELTLKKEGRAEWAKLYNNAKRAGIVKPFIDSVAEKRKALEERKKAYDRLCEAAEKNKTLADKAKENYVNHTSGEADFEKNKQLVARYEAKRPYYEGVSEIDKELKAAKENENKALLKENAAKKKCDECDETLVGIKREYEALKAEHTRLVDLRFAGMVGELARSLRDGEPCPVCGSTEHVKIAECSGESISKERVDIKQKEVDIKYEEMERAGDNKKSAEEAFNACHKLSEEARNKVVELSAKFESMKKNMSDGINSLNELIFAIGELEKKIKAYSEKKAFLENELKARAEAYSENRTKASEAEKEVMRAKEQSEEASKALEECISKNGFASEEEARNCILSDKATEELKTKCAEYDADVKNNTNTLCKLEKELEGIIRPDKAACEKVISDATAAKEEYAKTSGILLDTIKRLRENEKTISSESDGMEKKLSDAEADLLVAKKVCGYTGIGLQRYVLGIMFSSVVAEANHMLELFNGGRYRLFRTDEKKSGSNKSGLDLKVFDKYSDDENGRFVESLSGGEKFLTSLALSIGMSAIARRGGIKIEAMFIDEGFGTLDNNCVEDAMNILESVKRANGVVGIISHMEILRGRIPTKLIAVDDGQGSHLVKSIG